LSSSEPNLQNIPYVVNGERRIRETFIAQGNRLILSADYSRRSTEDTCPSQRGPGKLINAFITGVDVHENRL
jgi:DNA polymerase-1